MGASGLSMVENYLVCEYWLAVLLLMLMRSELMPIVLLIVATIASILACFGS